MKSLLVSIIAAVLLMGCGEAQESSPLPETRPDEPVAEEQQKQSTQPAEVKTVDPDAEVAQPEPLLVKLLNIA